MSELSESPLEDLPEFRFTLFDIDAAPVGSDLLHIYDRTKTEDGFILHGKLLKAMPVERRCILQFAEIHMQGVYLGTWTGEGMFPVDMDEEDTFTLNQCSLHFTE